MIPGHPTHAPCVVCTDAFGTRFMCADCRADPANASWTERPRCEVLRDDADDEDETSAERGHLDPVPERRDPLQLKLDILNCIACRQIRVAQRVRRRVNGRRVWVWEWVLRPLTLREVAWMTGCDEAYVRRVYRSVTSS